MTEVATTYGQALYELARDENLTQDILGQLTVLRDVLTRESDFVTLLCTPSIPKQERTQVLDDALRASVHPYVLNFLKILTEKGYVKHFSDCCKFFRQQYNKDNGILEVTAVTKLPLSQELQIKLTDKISAITGKTIDLVNKVDPEVLGGVRLDLDGRSVDGTVRARLDDIRSILKNTVL
ncbi:MAG: ATP synthase F1 subunit delta [Clostridia bacterium]|nr:ATP synthase F1 subunit delta [Clostridia bacterium]